MFTELAIGKYVRIIKKLKPAKIAADKMTSEVPNGHHWEKWTIETKAAAISMWTEELKLSSWQTYKVIHTVNDYYSKSDKNTPAVYLIQAAAQQ